LTFFAMAIAAGNITTNSYGAAMMEEDINIVIGRGKKYENVNYLNKNFLPCRERVKRPAFS